MASRPLQEPSFLIMTSLASGPQHGYAVLTDVEQISDGRVKLRAGTLYAAFDRLRSDGLVAVDHEEVVAGRLRRYYRLTDAGATRLATEAERAAQNARAATQRLRALRPAGAAVAGGPA